MLGKRVLCIGTSRKELVKRFLGVGSDENTANRKHDNHMCSTEDLFETPIFKLRVTLRSRFLRGLCYLMHSGTHSE